MQKGDEVIFMLGVGSEKGEIVRLNNKTVVVKLPSGGVIKRHIDKHKVKPNA